MLKQIVAGVLNVGYREYGDAGDGRAPLVLLHGFPYDIHAYDEVVALWRAHDPGRRIVVPYLRGYGSTRFLAAETLRSGQQAALAHDLLALLDALRIDRAVLAGYDWGGRAACIVAALWPERVRGLVSGDGYNVQNIALAGRPAAPEIERRLWYQYYFHGERGRAGLAENRHQLGRLLWRQWSPQWRFDDATYERSAAAFDNPDFVAVVIHSYRHRYALVGGDPAYEPTERRLAEQPTIGVPSVLLFGGSDGVAGAIQPLSPAHFSGRWEQRTLPGIGHNLPQEAPQAFVDALRTVAG